MDIEKKERADKLIADFDQKLFDFGLHKLIDDVKIGDNYAVFFFKEEAQGDVIYNILSNSFPDNSRFDRILDFVRVVIEF